MSRDLSWSRLNPPAARCSDVIHRVLDIRQGFRPIPVECMLSLRQHGVGRRLRVGPCRVDERRCLLQRVHGLIEPHVMRVSKRNAQDRIYRKNVAVNTIAERRLFIGSSLMVQRELREFGNYARSTAFRQPGTDEVDLVTLDPARSRIEPYNRDRRGLPYCTTRTLRLSMA